MARRHRARRLRSVPARRAGGRARARCRRAQGRRAAAAPARRGRRRWSNSTPIGVGPPSTISSMRPRRSASTCAAVVGETWPDRLADGATTGRPKAAQQVLRHRVVRHPQRDAVEPGGGEVGDRAAGSLRHDQRQRARPECLREPLGGSVESAQCARCRHVRDMRDQWVEGRPAFRLVKPGNGLAVGGIGAEPVDGFGRKRHKTALCAARGRLFPRPSVGSSPHRRSEVRVPPSYRYSCLRPRRGMVIRPAISRSVAQPGRAPRSGRGGRRFKSYHSDQSIPPDVESVVVDRNELRQHVFLQRLKSTGCMQARPANGPRIRSQGK